MLGYFLALPGRKRNSYRISVLRYRDRGDMVLVVFTDPTATPDLTYSKRFSKNAIQFLQENCFQIMMSQSFPGNFEPWPRHCRLGFQHTVWLGLPTGPAQPVNPPPSRDPARPPAFKSALASINSLMCRGERARNAGLSPGRLESDPMGSNPCNKHEQKKEENE